MTLAEILEEIQLKEMKDIDLEWVDELQVNLGNMNSCYSYLFIVERKLSAIYLEELELIIHF